MNIKRQPAATRLMIDIKHQSDKSSGLQNGLHCLKLYCPIHNNFYRHTKIDLFSLNSCNSYQFITKAVNEIKRISYVT